MPLIQLTHKATLLDGDMVPVSLDLRTLAPVTIKAIQFHGFARLIICADAVTQDRIIGDSRRPSYQMMQPTPDGVLFEQASNVIYDRFNYTKPVEHPDKQNIWRRFPQGWAPVVVRSMRGSLPCVIEARQGNEKHRAKITIDLYVTF